MNRFIPFTIVLTVLLGVLSPAYAQKKKKGGGGMKEIEEHVAHEEYLLAVPKLEQIVKFDRNSARAHFLLGKCYFKLYQKEKALPMFDRARLLNKSVDEELPYYHGQVYHHVFNFRKAINMYNEFLLRTKASDPRNLEIQIRLQQAKYAQKHRDEFSGFEDIVKIVNMGDSINTAFSEHSPVISSNDSVLLFTARRPGNIGTPDTMPSLEEYDEDIYVSYYRSGRWSKAENIGRPVNTAGHDATVSLTWDGGQLYLYRHDKGGSVYKTEFDQDNLQWKNPKIIGAPVKSKYHEPSVFMTPDSTVIFFSSDRPGGIGGRDLYMCKRKKKGRWDEPVNLGPTINTPYDEDAPFLHIDGRTLYYSSNGLRSVGGFDIFKTEWINDSTFSKPENMGFPINTADDDIYFVITESGKTGYYSSGKDDGYGEKDIYEIHFPYFPFPSNVMRLEGIVADSISGERLTSTIMVIDKETSELVQTLTTTPSDSFKMILFAGHSYDFIVNTEGYDPIVRHLESPKMKSRDTTIQRIFRLYNAPVVATTEEVDIREIPDEIPPNIVFNIYFDFDKSSLRSESEIELDKITEILANEELFTVTIVGHTDAKGTNAYNDRLSLRRAKAAYSYLRKSGVDTDRMAMLGLSEDEPVADNETEEGRQYNRRVEFKLYKKDYLIIESRKLDDVRVVE